MGAVVTVKELEQKVTEINTWLEAHDAHHPLIPQKLQSRAYYVRKLTQMDEYKLETIKI